MSEQQREWHALGHSAWDAMERGRRKVEHYGFDETDKLTEHSQANSTNQDIQHKYNNQDPTRCKYSEPQYTAERTQNSTTENHFKYRIK